MSLKLVSVGRCPACKSTSGHQELFRLEKFNVYSCPCGLKFIDPSLDEQSMIDIYQSSEHLKEINPVLEHYYEYETLSPNSKTYRGYLQALNNLKKLTQGRDLIEVGCGRGSFLKVAHQNGWHVLGIDSSSENIEAVQKSGMSGACVDYLSYSPVKKYDVIVLWDLIEHPQDPGKFVKKSFELLKPNGLLLIATPYDPSLLSIIASWLYRVTKGKMTDPLRKFYVIEHTSYFNRETLSRLLSQYGFETASVWKTETDLDRYYFPKLTKMAVKFSFLIANLLHLQNRLMFIARKRP